MPRKQKPARLYQRKDDGAWIILDGGRQIRTGYGDGFRKEAVAVLEEHRDRKALSELGIRPNHDVTVGEVLVYYGECKITQLAAGDRQLYAIQALSKYWGNRRVSQVDRFSCQEYAKSRKVKPSTVRRELGTLRAALNLAALDSKIASAPGLELPPESPPKDRWLTRSEVAKLLWHASPHVRRFILIAVYSGRRKSAIMALRWVPSIDCGWVDLNRGRIEFLGKGKTETTKRKGAIRMPRQLRVAVSTWSDGNPNVVHYKGQRIREIKKGIAGAAERAGIEGVTPHVLKHTAITWAFINGMSLDDAVDYFATSRHTIEKVYRAYHPDFQSRAVEAMERRAR